MPLKPQDKFALKAFGALALMVVVELIVLYMVFVPAVSNTNYHMEPWKVIEIQKSTLEQVVCH